VAEKRHSTKKERLFRWKKWSAANQGKIQQKKKGVVGKLLQKKGRKFRGQQNNHGKPKSGN